MSQNELIIGLGGCGGRSIKEFRRTVEMRFKDYAYIKEKGTKIDYLYIDSNDDILDANDWSVFGKNIRLEANQMINLKQSGVSRDIDAISAYPNIEPWIGDIKDSFRQRSSASGDDEVRNTLHTMKGAGQLRRYGRALFAMHSSTVRTTLAKKIDDLVTGRENKVTFRIFCTLGGGTGSGSLIDMITLIQSLCKEKTLEDQSVIVYAYVAASKADSANAGSFYENEYCSLRDLNALMVGSYHPVVTGMPFNDARDSEFNLPLPINRVYLSSDLAPGTPMLSDQIKSVTAACFDSIVYAHSYNDDVCLKAISDEDLVDVEGGEKDSLNRLVRSYRYSVMGSRRWRVPTTQIRELLNCETEVRVWDSMLNGNKLPDFKRDISQLEGFNFGFELTETSEVYKEIEAELIKPITAQYEEIKTQKRRDEKVLTDLRAKAEALLLVSKKLNADQNKKVRFINSYKKSVATIEQELLMNLDNAITWDIKPSVWGLKDVKRYLADLRRTLTDWLNIYAPNSTLEEIDSERGIICDLMQEREAQWSKLGMLTIQFTKLDERMMEAQYADACSLVLNSLKEYKRIVLSELMKKIDDMIRSIEASLNELINGMESTRANTSQLIATLAKELRAHADTSNEQGMRDMFAYDDKNLKAVREAMTEQIDLHQEEMKKYTDALKKSVGDGSRMILCSRNTLMSFVNDIRAGILDATMVRVHDKAVDVASLDSVLIGNIIDRLAQIGSDVSANWESRLGPLVEQFMREMPISAEINGNDGLRSPQVSPAASIVIGLPGSATNLELLDWLKKKITSSRPNQYTILGNRSEFYEHKTSEEIRVLYVVYWMPCRFATVSAYVEGRYQRTLEENDRAKIYFANYDITGEDGGKKFSRPALTKSGEPDEKNISTTALCESLFIRVKGEKKPVVMYTSRGIEFAKEVDKYDGINYASPYSETQKRFPGASYKSDMMKALRMAVRESTDANLYASMTQAEKEAVYQVYTDKVVATSEGSDEWLKARAERTLVRELLEL